MSEKTLNKEMIEQKVTVLTENFDNINEQIMEKRDSIEEIRKEIIALQDEQKRLQGEYRLIVSLGSEFNLIDENKEVTEE